MSPTLRISNRVGGGLALAGAILSIALYGSLAFGLVAFYVSLQSGILHAFSVMGSYTASATLRYATTGLALGACLTLHGTLRIGYSDAYLEHIGGPPLESPLQTGAMIVNHLLVPLFAILHVWRAPVVNPVWPMLFAALELGFITLAHDFLAPEDVERPDGRVIQIYASSVVACAAWVLLMETANRFFAQYD